MRHRGHRRAAGLVTEFDGGGGGRKEEEGGARDVRGREKEKSDGQRGQRVDNGPRPDDDDDERASEELN